MKEKELKFKYIDLGKEIVGSKFIVQEETRDIITNLLKYFTGNESNINPAKGVYLYGNFGVGKTIIFKILQRVLAQKFWMSENGFQITSLEQIIEIFKKDGHLDYYGYRRESTPMHLCINEFGKKMNEKIYGTDADELIYSLFMTRYELFQMGKLTHVTSNFHPDKINVENIIRDRIVEMFNFIEIKGNSLRK